MYQLLFLVSHGQRNMLSINNKNDVCYLKHHFSRIKEITDKAFYTYRVHVYYF